jgi:hypothetical protein
MRSKTTNKKGFTFGKNWLFFVSKYFGPEVVVEAEKSLKDLLIIHLKEAFVDVVGRVFFLVIGAKKV